jgi:hypothetical protein
VTLAHSPLAPSAADRWVFCPASVPLAAQFPALVEDPSAAEGSASHWAGFSMLKTHTPKPGEICPENGVQLTEEMLEGALVYNNAVFAIANRCGGLAAAHLEERVAISSLHAAMFGTPDCWIYDKSAGVLYVIDYKFGHRGVDPFENWQLVSYTRGILDSLGLNGLAEQHLKVCFVIVQPRSYHRGGPVRTWETTAASLRGQWNLLHAAAAEALGPAPSFAAGSHCRDCPARRACPTLARNTQAVMDLANAEMPIELTPGQLGVELAYLRRAGALLTARLKALEQQAEVSIREGKGVPGFALEPGRGRTDWAVDVAEVESLGAMCGVNLLKAPAAVTPSQAKGLLTKQGLDTSVIAAYSSQTRGGLTLVDAAETLAHRVFAKGSI